MKRLINSLCIISVIALLAIILATIFLEGKSPRMSFIYLYLIVILLALAIPLLLGGFSLAWNKDKIKPPIWLSIYGALLITYVVIMLNLGFVDMIKDLPLFIREEYTVTDGTVQTVKFTKSAQVITVQGITFRVDRDIFNIIDKEGRYRFVYLPNSKYLIDIIDENEVSQLK